MQPKSDNEPEMPVTNYNYGRYFNESRVLIRNCYSGINIEQVKKKIEKESIIGRNKLAQNKYNSLIKLNSESNIQRS